MCCKTFILKFAEFIAVRLYTDDMISVNNILKRDYVSITSVNTSFVEMLIEAEDHRFNKHCGVDIIGVARALYIITTKRKIQGASTIEQQLVRTITGDYRLNIRRKIKEITLAVSINRKHKKLFLAKAYIYYAYYGWMMNGINNAMKRENLKNEQITITDAARLMALLKYPLPQFPSENRLSQIALRTEHILSRYAHRRSGYAPVI